MKSLFLYVFFLIIILISQAKATTGIVNDEELETWKNKVSATSSDKAIVSKEWILDSKPIKESDLEAPIRIIQLVEVYDWLNERIRSGEISSEGIVLKDLFARKGGPICFYKNDRVNISVLKTVFYSEKKLRKDMLLTSLVSENIMTASKNIVFKIGSPNGLLQAVLIEPRHHKTLFEVKNDNANEFLAQKLDSFLKASQLKLKVREKSNAFGNSSGSGLGLFYLTVLVPVYVAQDLLTPENSILYSPNLDNGWLFSQEDILADQYPATGVSFSRNPGNAGFVSMGDNRVPIEFYQFLSAGSNTPDLCSTILATIKLSNSATHCWGLQLFAQHNYFNQNDETKSLTAAGLGIRYSSEKEYRDFRAGIASTRPVAICDMGWLLSRAQFFKICGQYFSGVGSLSLGLGKYLSQYSLEIGVNLGGEKDTKGQLETHVIPYLRMGLIF